MCSILIVDNYLHGKKRLIEIIGIIIPVATIFQADSLADAMDILEQRKIDILLLNNDVIKPREVNVIQKLTHKPVTIIVTDDDQMRPVSQITKLGAVGYFIRSSYIMKLIEGFVNRENNTNDNEVKLMLESALGTYPVKIDSIVAVEKTKRNMLDVYTKEKILRDVRGTLSELVKVLPKDFVHISRQCIVDRRAISRIITKSQEIFINIEEGEIGFVCSRERIRNLIEWFNTIKKVF